MKLKCSYLFCTAILTVVLQADSAYKILIFNPRISNSNVRFLGNVADILIEAGHNVTQLSIDFDPLADMIGSKLAKTIRIEIDRKIFDEFKVDMFVQDAWKRKQQSIFAMIKAFGKMKEMLVKHCEAAIKNTEVMEQLKDAKFDLAISQFDPCFFGMDELFQIPTHVLVCSVGVLDGIAENIGMPIFPSYVPNIVTPYTEEMTYFQRVGNLLLTLISKYWFRSITANDQRLFRQLYGEQFVDLREKTAQVTYVMTNTDPLFDFPKPTIHKVIEIGGLSVPKPKPLNETWSAVMNLRKATVLVSFGSVALSHLMPSETKQTLLETFDQFPDVTFIWKYEKEEDRIADGHPNVITGAWLPQTDLLAHPNLVAFVTHGGMNSITETLDRGKPVIVVPVFGDQRRNAVLAKRSGFGIVLSISELTEKYKLRDALQKIIYDKNYARKAEELSKMIAKRPNPSREQLIKHVEFAAEFGQISNFDPYGRKMSFVSYFMLDIIVPFVLIVLFLIVGLTYGIFRLFTRYILKCNHKGLEAKKVQ